MPLENKVVETVLEEWYSNRSTLPASGHLATSGEDSRCHSGGRQCRWHLEGGGQVSWVIQDRQTYKQTNRYVKRKSKHGKINSQIKI